MYLRTDLQGQEQVILDVNHIQAKSAFVSIGQVKLSADQQTMAYTVDKDGSEVFEARLQSTKGASCMSPPLRRQQHAPYHKS